MYTLEQKNILNIDYHLFDELTKCITRLLQNNVESIILYGSVARNEADEESDIDIAIIVNNKLDKNIFDKLMAEIFEINLKNNVLFSISDIEKKTFDKWKNTLCYYNNILKEGIVLWNK